MFDGQSEYVADNSLLDSFRHIPNRSFLAYPQVLIMRQAYLTGPSN